MELTDVSGGARVVLQPVDYEFASVNGDAWDDNWLVIAGEVASGGQEWSFRHPFLLVDEVVEIAEWFERVANRLEAPTRLSATGKVVPSLAFTEPNVAFSVQSYGEDTVVVRVHFSLEALPPDRRASEADQFGQHTFWVVLEIPLKHAASAAATLRKDVAAFPIR